MQFIHYPITNWQDQFTIIIFMCSHFRIILIFGLWECLRQQEDVFLQENLACSMITISENAAPIITIEWSSVPLQEAWVSGFSFLYSSDLWHQHNQCKYQSIANEEHLQVVIKYSYLPFWRKHYLLMTLDCRILKELSECKD